MSEESQNEKVARLLYTTYGQADNGFYSWHGLNESVRERFRRQADTIIHDLQSTEELRLRAELSFAQTQLSNLNRSYDALYEENQALATKLRLRKSELADAKGAEAKRLYLVVRNLEMDIAHLKITQDNLQRRLDKAVGERTRANIRVDELANALADAERRNKELEQQLSEPRPAPRLTLDEIKLDDLDRRVRRLETIDNRR